MTRIKCLVEECLYNKDFICSAEVIEVRSSGDRMVNVSDGSKCNTFKKRN